LSPASDQVVGTPILDLEISKFRDLMMTIIQQNFAGRIQEYASHSYLNESILLHIDIILFIAQLLID